MYIMKLHSCVLLEGSTFCMPISVGKTWMHALFEHHCWRWIFRCIFAYGYPFFAPAGYPSWISSIQDTHFYTSCLFYIYRRYETISYFLHALVTIQRAFGWVFSFSFKSLQLVYKLQPQRGAQIWIFAKWGCEEIQRCDTKWRITKDGGGSWVWRRWVNLCGCYSKFVKTFLLTSLGKSK